MRLQIGVRPRDRRKPALHQTGDRGPKAVAEIGVAAAAAVARPPSCVDSQLHQVRESLDAPCAMRLAASERSETVEVDGLPATRGEVAVYEREVGELVLGVVMDVLRHVRVQNGQCLFVRLVPVAAGNLAILNTTEFVVLLPQICLENLSGR